MATLDDGSAGAFCGAGMGPMHMHHTGAAMSDDHMSGSGSGTGMAMYMSGFRFTLLSHPADVPCLNLFFPSWTLDTRAKFLLAMVSVALLSVATEGVSFLRLRSRRTMTAGRTKQGTILALHSLQALLGYALMIAAMTFSIELLLSVVLGLALGYALFFEERGGGEPVARSSSARGEGEGGGGGGSSSVTPRWDVGTAAHVTTNPCCAFMADEAAELVGGGEMQGDEATGDAENAGQDGQADEETNGSVTEPLLRQRRSAD